MLRFAVYDNHGRASEWPLVNPYLIGHDDQVIRGEVQFNDGVLDCHHAGQGPVGLCLLHEVESVGQFMLQTTLLPPRDEPYLLTVELARHRIQFFIAKSEEWQMFDLSAGHPAMRHWEEARRLFTEAVTARTPLEADQAARMSLIHGVEATERLAMAHAEILLHRRYATRPASSATLGVRVAPQRDAKPLQDIVQTDFDLLYVPIVWRQLEIEEGRYNWEPLDRWIDWARSVGKPVVAGPLLDFSKRALPKWMYVWQHDYDTCRDLAYDYVERVVSRYKDAVGLWSIGCGLNLNDNFEFRPDQMIDLARMAALQVREAKKGARVMLEIARPFGEHMAHKRSGMPPMVFIERMLSSGVRIDAVGVHLLFGNRHSGLACRDLMQISALLDRFFNLEVPIVASAMGVPSDTSNADGGWWHERWSPDVQSRWVSRMFAVAMSKPFVETVFWADLYDHDDALLPRAGLITDAGRVKPALQRLVGIRKRLRKPLGPLRLPTRKAEADL